MSGGFLISGLDGLRVKKDKNANAREIFMFCPQVCALQNDWSELEGVHTVAMNHRAPSVPTTVSDRTLRIESDVRRTKPTQFYCDVRER